MIVEKIAYAKGKVDGYVVIAALRLFLLIHIVTVKA